MIAVAAHAGNGGAVTSAGVDDEAEAEPAGAVLAAAELVSAELGGAEPMAADEGAADPPAHA